MDPPIKTSAAIGTVIKWFVQSFKNNCKTIQKLQFILGVSLFKLMLSGKDRKQLNIGSDDQTDWETQVYLICLSAENNQADSCIWLHGDIINVLI